MTVELRFRRDREGRIDGHGAYARGDNDGFARFGPITMHVDVAANTATLTSTVTVELRRVVPFVHLTRWQRFRAWLREAVWLAADRDCGAGSSEHEPWR